jgi:membrane-associated protein
MRHFHRHFKDYVRFAIAPLALLAAYAGFFLIYKWFDLPSPHELVAVAGQFYMRYGGWMLFAAAFVEGLLFVNWYVPGSSLLAIGVVFARQHEWDMLQVGAIVTSGFYAALVIDYVLGFYGWHNLILRFGMKEPLEKAQERMKKYGLVIIFSMYFQPNLASLAATSAGIFRESFGKFLLYSAGALLFWNSIWGLVLYWFGPRILEYVGMRFIFLVLIVWLIVLTVTFIRKRSRRRRLAV